jgi:hypothetical protein
MLGSKYARLAAAFGDTGALDMMERAYAQLTQTDFGQDFSSMRYPSALAGYRADLAAMAAIKAAVDDSPVGVPVSSLVMVSRRAKSQLAWMQKVGTAHVISGVAYAGPAPELKPTVVKVGCGVVSSVPTLSDRYPTLDSLVTEDHKRFYEAFRQSVTKGKPLDLEENLTYGFILVREAVIRRDIDPAYLEQVLHLFTMTYSGDRLGWYARKWYADLAFLKGDLAEGYHRLTTLGRGIGLTLELYVNTAPFVNDNQVTAKMVDAWTGSSNGLTAYGERHKRGVAEHLTSILDGYHKDLGRSVVMDAWVRLISGRYAHTQSSLSKSDLGPLLTEEDLRTWYGPGDEERPRNLYQKPYAAFEGILGLQALISWPRKWEGSYWFHVLMQRHFKTLYRRAENALRHSEGVVPVGEGWVSEVALLNAMRNAFPTEQIIHQARPSWLGQQSFDIYFPELRVAIEYQGVQHSQPVERFGGEEAFERQQERDSRKRELCIQNGVTLIEVHPDYDADETVEVVNRALVRTRQQAERNAQRALRK